MREPGALIPAPGVQQRHFAAEHPDIG